MITRKRPTSDKFSDGLDLRKWVSCEFPDHILDVVDIKLKEEANSQGTLGALHKLEQCCIQMVQLAMMCTEENSQKRPTASSAVRVLANIWKQMGFEAPSSEDKR